MTSYDAAPSCPFSRHDVFDLASTSPKHMVEALQRIVDGREYIARLPLDDALEIFGLLSGCTKRREVEDDIASTALLCTAAQCFAESRGAIAACNPQGFSELYDYCDSMFDRMSQVNKKLAFLLFHLQLAEALPRSDALLGEIKSSLKEKLSSRKSGDPFSYIQDDLLPEERHFVQSFPDAIASEGSLRRLIVPLLAFLALLTGAVGISISRMSSLCLTITVVCITAAFQLWQNQKGKMPKTRKECIQLINAAVARDYPEGVRLDMESILARASRLSDGPHSSTLKEEEADLSTLPLPKDAPGLMGSLSLYSKDARYKDAAGGNEESRGQRSGNGTSLIPSDTLSTPPGTDAKPEVPESRLFGENGVLTHLAKNLRDVNMSKDANDPNQPVKIEVPPELVDYVVRMRDMMGNDESVSPTTRDMVNSLAQFGATLRAEAG